MRGSRRFNKLTPAWNNADCTISPAPWVTILPLPPLVTTSLPVWSRIAPTEKLTSLRNCPFRQDRAISKGVKISVIGGPCTKVTGFLLDNANPVQPVTTWLNTSATLTEDIVLLFN